MAEIDDDVAAVFRGHMEQLEGLRQAIDLSIARQVGRADAWFTEEWSAVHGALTSAIHGVTCARCGVDVAVTLRMGEGHLCATCASKEAA